MGNPVAIKFTFLINICSTNFSLFTVDLVGLLRWKAKMDEVREVLISLLKIDGEEIVKVSFLCRWERFSLDSFDVHQIQNA